MSRAIVAGVAVLVVLHAGAMLVIVTTLAPRLGVAVALGAPVLAALVAAHLAPSRKTVAGLVMALPDATFKSAAAVWQR